MKFVAILCVLSAVCFVSGQTDNDPGVPCNATTPPSALYRIVWNSINEERAKVTTVNLPPLALSSQLSHVARWKVEDPNWGHLPGCLIDNYGYTSVFPITCCVNNVGDDCTDPVIAVVPNSVVENTYSYIGFSFLNPAITEANAAEEIPKILAFPVFNFILGGVGNGPNPSVVAPEADKIGIGISDDGQVFTLILGDAATTARNYITCLTPDPGAPCDATTEPSAVYVNLLAGINEARALVPIPSPGTGMLPPLPMSSQLSHVALWKIADANWGVVTGCTLPNFGYALNSPNAGGCCGEAGTGDATLCTTKALAGLSTNPISDETSYSYIGAQDLTTPITEANAIEQITLLLADPMFAFILAGAGDNVNSPNPVAPAPIPKTLGIGLNADGNRIALILGNDNTAGGGTGTGYIDCLVTHTSTSTITTTISTNTSTDSPSGANNLGVGFVTLGVVTAAFLNP